MVNTGPAGAVQSADQSPSTVSQSLGSCDAPADKSRDIRTIVDHR